MKITAIQKQKKNDERYSIFLDGSYSFSLLELELVKSGLRLGQEITPDELHFYNDISITGKALDAAYLYLSFRPRSIKETRKYLYGKFNDSDAIEKIIDQLQQQSYLDDSKFAMAWVLDRQALRPRSLQKLKVELLQKGIDKDVIDDVLMVMKPDQVEAAKKLIEQKRLITRYDDKQKLVQYLAGQGFRYTEIKQALEELV